MLNHLIFKSLSKPLRPARFLNLKSSVTGLVQIQTRGIKDPPRFNEEDTNKINRMDLAAYFDDFMKRRP